VIISFYFLFAVIRRIKLHNFDQINLFVIFQTVKSVNRVISSRYLLTFINLQILTVTASRLTSFHITVHRPASLSFNFPSFLNTYYRRCSTTYVFEFFFFSFIFLPNVTQVHAVYYHCIEAITYYPSPAIKYKPTPT